MSAKADARAASWHGSSARVAVISPPGPGLAGEPLAARASRHVADSRHAARTGVAAGRKGASREQSITPTRGGPAGPAEAHRYLTV
jgi:hypothetical protein